MKFLALTTLFVSFASVACPDLAGTFATCTSSTGAVTTGPTITQSTSVDGITTYVVNSVNEETNEPESETVLANGVTTTTTQTDPESGMTFSMTSKYSCIGSALSLDLGLETQGQSLANMNVKITKVGSQLKTVTTGTAMGETINETEVCE